MRRPGGYAITVEPDKGDIELDTFTCCHCNSVVFVKPHADPADLGGFCVLCMKHVCRLCAGKGCVPFERRLEAMERRDRLMRAARGG